MKSFSNVFKQLVARALEAHKLRKRCENKDWKSKQTMTASKKLSYSQTDLWSEQTDTAVLQTLSRISIIYMCAGFCESGPLSVCVCVCDFISHPLACIVHSYQAKITKCASVKNTLLSSVRDMWYWWAPSQSQTDVSCWENTKLFSSLSVLLYCLHLSGDKMWPLTSVN